MSQINKAPPFLELSSSRIQNFDTSGLDIENVLSIWTGLTKCSNFISNGKRLENISWRIVNRNLVNHNKIRTANENEVQVLPGSYKPLKNKLNNGDFKSLLSIVADEGLLFSRPTLHKRKSSSKNLTIRSKNNRSNESFESLARPSMFRKSSSSKSLKKLNHKKKSTTDLPSILSPHQNAPESGSRKSGESTTFVPTEHDSDLFEQPNPRLAFGVFDKLPNEPIGAPELTRSDTSTSIIRGFDPNQKTEIAKKSFSSASISPVKSSPSPQKPQSPSLFNQPKAQQQGLLFNSQSKPQHSSLFTSQPKQQQSSLFSHNQKPHNHGSHNQVGNPVERVKSPLSKESISDDESSESPVRQTTPLFQSKHQHNPKQEQPQSQKPKTLFEQVGISPDVKKPLPKAKRNNVLANLGMTSLLHTHHHHQPSHQQQQQEQQNSNPQSGLQSRELSPSDHPETNKNRSEFKDKSMFFIESSPSPSDSVTKLFDKNGRQLTSMQQNSNSEKPVTHLQHSHGSEKSHSSRENSGRSHSGRSHSGRSMKKKASLFSGQSRQLNFSSDSSLSEESDWSSVSETDDEEYDNKLREQWDALDFKRKDEGLSKPQIKRSLLSGLFLSEMHEPSAEIHHKHSHNSHHHNSHHQHQYHDAQQPHIQHHQQNQSPTSEEHLPQPKSQPRPLKFGPSDKSTTAAPSTNDLSSSVASSVQIKHRSGSSSNEARALELTSTEKHSVTSTSNVNVSGLVNEPYHNYQAKLHYESNVPQSDTNHQRTSSFTNLISKSALNLTNYFAHQRKNSFSSLASDRTRVKFTHESKAPPTASTILPTALSTHMFLPNAHQKAKSRLTAVVETSDSSSTSQTNSRKNSTQGAAADDSTYSEINSQYNKDSKNEVGQRNGVPGEILDPVSSPILPVPKKPITLDEIDQNSVPGAPVSNLEVPLKNISISRRLSPKTTRRQMLATELSESLRKSILWDRKLGAYPARGLKQPITKTASESVDDLTDTTDDKQINDKIVNNIDTNEKAWEEEDSTDFYTKGW